MEILTKHLRLREYKLEDVAAVLAYEADPEVIKHVCWGPATIDSLEKELSWHIEQAAGDSRRFYHLAIEQLPTSDAIGYCGLEIISERNKEAEIGYALHRDYWGQGLVTEAATAWLDYGFGPMGLHRIFAEVNPANLASIRVLEKLGMRHEGTMKQQKWCRDRWRDVALYAILADEWRQ